MAYDDHSETATTFKVGVADLAVSQDPDVLLCTAPLGAGLGIAIYDPVAKVGGVLHSLLPSSSIDPDWASKHPGMFVDTGLVTLLARVQQLNATRANLRMFVAGAAQILDEEHLFNVGKTNSDTLGELLAQIGVELCAQEVGGRNNCSMELVMATGEVRVKYCGQAEPITLCKPLRIT